LGLDVVIEAEEVAGGVADVVGAELEAGQGGELEGGLVDRGVLEAQALLEPAQGVYAGDQVGVERAGAAGSAVVAQGLGEAGAAALEVALAGQGAPVGAPVGGGEVVEGAGADLEAVVDDAGLAELLGRGPAALGVVLVEGEAIAEVEDVAVEDAAEVELLAATADVAAPVEALAVPGEGGGGGEAAAGPTERVAAVDLLLQARVDELLEGLAAAEELAEVAEQAGADARGGLEQAPHLGAAPHVEVDRGGGGVGDLGDRVDELAEEALEELELEAVVALVDAAPRDRLKSDEIGAAELAGL
jgi:hypothetical protein